jgi:hypothetical protein
VRDALGSGEFRKVLKPVQAMKPVPLPMVDATDVTVESLRFLSDGNRLRILQILARR